RLLVRPGDHVVVESPTFPGAIDAFARAGARITSIGTDAGGARLGELATVLAEGDVRVVYTIPTCQSPTGTVMGNARRRELAELVDASAAWSIEDETLAPLCFAGPPPAPAASYARSDRHVVVGSLSKQVWGGLRVGWLCADEVLVERFSRLRAATDLGAPVHAQLVALAALNGLEERTAALRTELERRCDLLCELVQRELPEWTLRRPEGGLSIWCRLPVAAGDALATVAPQLGVGVLAGSSAAADDRGADHVRLSFAAAPPRLELGVARLAEAWRVASDAVVASRSVG
ncbi:MAG: PLP-dependent aminotransferase family protein, partial [Microthrixaceae bacterium]